MRRDLPRAKRDQQQTPNSRQNLALPPNILGPISQGHWSRSDILYEFSEESSFALDLNNVGKKYAIYYKRIVLETYVL